MSKKIKQYRITFPIKTTRGLQSYIVKANSEEEALTKHNEGLSEFEDELIEITSLGDPGIEEIHHE